MILGSGIEGSNFESLNSIRKRNIILQNCDDNDRTIFGVSFASKEQFFGYEMALAGLRSADSGYKLAVGLGALYLALLSFFSLGVFLSTAIVAGTAITYMIVQLIGGFNLANNQEAGYGTSDLKRLYEMPIDWFSLRGERISLTLNYNTLLYGFVAIYLAYLISPIFASKTIGVFTPVNVLISVCIILFASIIFYVAKANMFANDETMGELYKARDGMGYGYGYEALNPYYVRTDTNSHDELYDIFNLDEVCFYSPSTIPDYKDKAHHKKPSYY